MKRKPGRGKQHSAKGLSFRNVARTIHKLAMNPDVNIADPRALLHAISDALMAEGVRLQKIKR